MNKANPSDGGGSPLSPRSPRHPPQKAPYQQSSGCEANSGGYSPSPSLFHEDHRRELETLRAKLEAERLNSREARRHFADEARELRQAAEQDRQMLADQLRSKWEQQRARELHQLKEENSRQREAEIRQLMRWKEAELREAQELLQQERDAAMRQARDLQRQLAKELVSRGSSSRGEGGGSSGVLSSETHAKLQEVLGKLRWEVDGDQAAKIRHLKAELELERSLFLRYILERFEGEPLSAGSPQRFRQASSPQQLAGARPQSLESIIAACIPDVAAVSKSCSLVHSQSQCESPCHNPPPAEGSPAESSCPEQPPKIALNKELDVEERAKQKTSVDLPPEGKANSWRPAGARAEDVLPQPNWLSGNSYVQLMKQNTDLLNARMDLEQRCTHLSEQNVRLRKKIFPDKVKWLKRKTAELAAIAKRLEECAKKFQELALLKQYEDPKPEAEEERKRCDDIELKLNKVLSEIARISEENSQLHENNKWAEKIANENADLKAKLVQATDERNAAVRLSDGLEVKMENLEQAIKNMRESQIKKCGILESELPQATFISTKRSCPEKWEQDTYHCRDSTNYEDCISTASADVTKSPLKLRVFLARYSYDPFDGPNKNPEAELPLTAGEYVYVCGEMDEDGFYMGELTDGRRGLVPSNAVEEVAGNDLISFIPLEPSDVSRNPLHETAFPCQSASSEEKSNSPDEDTCVSLLSNNPEVPLCEVQEAVPCPQNLTLIKQSARSIVIGWDPPQMPDSWGEILSYNIYVDTELRQNVKNGCERKTVIENLDLKLRTYRISVQSLTNKGRSDIMRCTFLVGNPSRIALTFLNLRNITATSAEITWLPSNSNYTHAVYLNEKEYDVTKAGIYGCTLQNLRPNTQYSVRVEPLVPNEVLVYPQGELEQKSIEVTFTTPSAGPPDAPLDVQVQAGSSADLLVISWIPVTINASGSSNGVKVTGYAVYINGQKATEIMSPTAGSVSLEASRIKMLQGPQTVSVRTVSPFGESEDSVPALIPSTLQKVPCTLLSKFGASGLAFKEFLETEGRPVSVTTCTTSSCYSPVCVSNSIPTAVEAFTEDTSKKISEARVTKNMVMISKPDSRKGCVMMTAEDSAYQSSLENRDASRLSLEPRFSSLEFGQRKHKEEGIVCLQEAPEISPEKQPEQSSSEHSKLTVSKAEAQEDNTLRTGSWWSSLGDYGHNSYLSDIEEEEDQENKSSVSGKHVGKLQEKPEPPAQLAKDTIMALRADQTVTNSSPRRNVAAGDSVGDNRARLFVALFDYDPTTMSPNSDADEEELAFKKGQVLKVIGDKDADGFYRGECDGKKGFVPCNMVSEMRIDSVEVRNQLLKKAYEE
ncbi:peripheral-type benzodiazepine receptor-associated protein 1-like [Sphaerodactylus townsendi]|uniref:peripheral-type benzodiazepine receptor-associated protein 1-like n=1 Tax=Sphaerodactylus townsendi TaxID=933632 RepID=UPI00202712EC|nr:peripheral-type benzodiazepine receptor-associated protein 1-like [Sphaerodactylus townsendi]